MAEMLVALGANLPHAGRSPQETCEAALAALDAEPGLAVVRRSSLWRTPAVPAGSGPDFVNAAAAVETRLSPAAVLDALHRVEARLGRARQARWAPRACDLDLVAAGGTVLPDTETAARWMALGQRDAAAAPAPGCLVLPHPRLHERAFVLLPLEEIAPGWRHPLTGRTPADMLSALPAGALAGIERL